MSIAEAKERKRLSSTGNGWVGFAIDTLRQLVDPVGYEIKFRTCLMEAEIGNIEEAYREAGLTPENDMSLSIWPKAIEEMKDGSTRTWRLQTGTKMFMLTLVTQNGPDQSLTRVEHIWGTTKTEVVVSAPIEVGKDGKFVFKGFPVPVADKVDASTIALGTVEHFGEAVTVHLARLKSPPPLPSPTT